MCSKEPSVYITMHPYLLIVLVLLSNASLIAAIVTACAGREHACEITDINLLKCWGDNTYGQLGMGDYVSRGTLPGQVPASFVLTPEIVADVVCGDAFTCIRGISGKV